MSEVITSGVVKHMAVLASPGVIALLPYIGLWPLPTWSNTVAFVAVFLFVLVATTPMHPGY